MLVLHIAGDELFDENTSEFIQVKPATIKLQHSLVSISKWESRWHVPFLKDDEKTPEQLLDYIKCMTVTQNVPDNVYLCLSEDNLKAVLAYIGDPMTATWFPENKNKAKGSSNEIPTSELIYYWMISYQIPMECQKWHLNRLMTLIRICNVKSQGSKNMSKKDLYNQNRALNAQRKARLHSRG